MTLNKFILFFAVLLSVAHLADATPEDDFFENTTAFSEDQIDSTAEFMVTVWKTGDGLPANDILDLRETPDGYLWMGTLQGLARFDGVRFETFFNTPTGSRYATRIEPLEIDAQGRLWFAPDQTGLICFDKGVFKEVLTNRTVLKERVRHLCSDGTNGMMWVDDRGALGRFSIEKPETAIAIKGAGSTSSRWLRDSQGQLWLASARTLKLYQQNKWRDVHVPGGANMEATPRREGGMWIAREARLRYVTKEGNAQEVASFPWAGQSRVTCMLEDRYQRLWIGTVDHGLYCYVDGTFTQVVSAPGSISCLLDDDQDNLWAGTRGGGLIRVRKRQFFVHNLTSGLQNESIRSIAQDLEGRVWILTAEGGLGWWQDGTWHSIGDTEGWPKLDSNSLMPTSDGSVWISTTRRGVWRFAKGKFSRRDLGTNAPREAIVDLLEDRQKRLWMVTDNTGIFCLETNKLTRYTAKEGLPSNLMRRMTLDDKGGVWAGDWEGGIARFRESDQQWDVMRKPSGHRDAVRSMIAAQEVMWIGTSSGGLLRLKNGKTTRITVEHGLPDVCIQQLLLDDRSSLWGSTPHRLFRISLAQLNAVMDGRPEKVAVTTYGRGDGLPDTSFASWNDPRCWRTTNGELWFATANGAIHFRPGNLQTNKPPQVFLEQTLLDGKPVATTALQMLRPEPGRLEFGFTAPCLSAPERIRFRYQMTGVDSDWVDAGTARTATYASIPVGHHVFRVSASSPEGVWNDQIASVALAIHPFFWQTNWFMAAVAAAIAGGGVWLIRRATVRRLRLRLEHLRQQQAIDRERARIAQDIHDELGANLTSIGLLADMGKRHKMDSSAVTRELNQISQTARESVTAMDAIVWALNPRNDSLDHFANYISQFTREFFRPTQLRTRLELPPNLPAQPLAMETRHQLFLIVKESFNNIVRHAEATEICLELACEDGHLRLIIADDGKGLSAEPAGEGHDGLVNLRERIKRLGGTLEIKTERGKGTRLEFIVPRARLNTN